VKITIGKLTEEQIQAARQVPHFLYIMLTRRAPASRRVEQISEGIVDALGEPKATLVAKDVAKSSAQRNTRSPTKLLPLPAQ
jgi:hypothetical protein